MSNHPGLTDVLLFLLGLVIGLVFGKRYGAVLAQQEMYAEKELGKIRAELKAGYANARASNKKI